MTSICTKILCVTVTRRFRTSLLAIMAVALCTALAIDGLTTHRTAQAQDRRGAMFAFGMTNGAGAARQLTASGVTWSYRYQYLAGGVNTGSGWTTWAPNSSFASNYMTESAAVGMTPVFTYYQLLQSLPATGPEADRDFANLNDRDTMRAYYREFTLLMDQAKAFGRPVIVHVEPDLSGYMQQRVVDSTNNASSIEAAVSNTGNTEIANLPNTYQGFNDALLRIRDLHAPNVLLATHASAWSTKVDITTSKDTSVDVNASAVKTSEFLATAGVGQRAGRKSTFDYVFVDVSDRDAAFHELVNGDGGAHWWDDTNQRRPNFETFDRYLAGLSRATKLPLMLWQVPIGNTVMRTQNNTWNHYQDNRVQYWLSAYPNDGRLASLAKSGVVAMLFGRGADGNTSAADSANDGTTNPPAINGNNRNSLSADDDGGYLTERMLAYQRSPLQLPSGSGQPAPPPPPPPASAAPTTTAVSPTPTPPASAVSPPPTSGSVSVVVTATRSGNQRISFTANSPVGDSVVRVLIDGVQVGKPITIRKSTKRRPRIKVTTAPLLIYEGPHTVAITVERGRVKMDQITIS